MEEVSFETWLQKHKTASKMQKWCFGGNSIVANTQLSLFYLEIFVARLLRGGVFQNISIDYQ